MAKATAIYTVIFDANSRRWSENPDINLLYLKLSQRMYDDLLHSKGYVFLRDIYEYLDVPLTKSCISTGWHRDCKWSDGYVDFDIKELDDGTYQLDFNVDGDISKYFA